MSSATIKYLRLASCLLLLTGGHTISIAQNNSDYSVDSSKSVVPDGYSTVNDNSSENRESFKPGKLSNDSSNVYIRMTGHATLEKFKKDKDFDYTGASENYKDTAAQHLGLPRGKGKTSDKGHSQGNGKASTPVKASDDSPGIISNILSFIGSIMWYLIIPVAIFAILYFIFKADLRALFRRNPKDYVLDGMDITEEELLQSDLDKCISEAEGRKDYRGAIRLYYLATLKELNNLGMITWQKDKTNRDYQYELYNTNKHEVFSELTLNFNRVWYGHMELSEQAYATLKVPFENFKLQFKARQ